ncbi:MAG TPA: alpha/beta hydrolase [Myxococcota bacterium]|nr:alpha/beta hydrolase [Myxococcota bacterium]
MSSGPMISIAVARLPADPASKRIGALVVNPGGPGVSAIDYLRWSWPRMSQGLRARFDLVAFDTRGTGRSAPLDCHASFAELMAQDPSPADDASWQRALAASRALAEECVAKDGRLLPYMGSVDNARDLDWLRAALGEEQISFLGYSYGTALGATYLTLYPDRVRAVVLDGSIDPSFDLEQFAREQAVAVENALTAYDAKAQSKGWHGVEELDAAFARAKTKSTVLYAAAEGLSSPPDGWHDLADALGREQAGDWSGLDDLATRYFGQRDDGTRELSIEAQLATLCADQHRMVSAEAYREALPRLAASSPHFGPGNLLSHLPCAFWPPPASALPEIGGRGGPPVLVLANSADPLTPHLWGERLAARFSRATRIDVDSSAHTAFGRGDPCVDGLVEGYLLAPAAPARTHCP